MKLSLLLKELNINLKRVKLIRHKDKRYDVNKIYQLGFIEQYQSLQSKPIFDNCEYILSFLGLEGTKAKYIGAWKICKKCSTKETKQKIDPNYPYQEHYNDCYYYEMKRVDIMPELIGRLIIDWGAGAINWHQYAYNDKEIIAILPQNNIRTVEDFQDYEKVILSFSELCTIIAEPMIYEDWHQALSCVNGIYLIVDRVSGQQYIGSAYGEDGIWGRWKNYTETKHGDNDGIKAELKKHPNAYKDFQFSILRILPKTITPDEVIKVENLYKQKLCSRELGMNRN